MRRWKEGNEMRVSVERLRWGLLAGVLLLVGVLVVLLSYGRYRAVKAWKQIVARSGVTITHETDGVTYSQAVRGKTVFTLHAARAVPHGDGQYTLENGRLQLYGANGQPNDVIYGSNFDYDEKTGVAKALGEVDMDLEPPAGVTAGKSGAVAKRVIHVKTSGLTYVKKLGVAATDKEVEIEYEGMKGWSKGAEFDSEQSVVHLLADVRAEAVLHGASVTLNAMRADLDRNANVIELTQPQVHSKGRVATAAMAVLHLRKDGSIEAIEARGAVTLTQGTRTVEAPTLNAALNERSQMQHAEMSGGVSLVDTSAARPMHGAAKTVKISCDGVGNPTSLVAEGGATLSAEQMAAGTQPLERQMGADRLTLALEKTGHGGTRVSAVHAQGGAWARAEAVARGANGRSAGLKTTKVSGDDLRLALVRDAAGKDEPQSLSGTGATRIEQRTADGAVQTSNGDTLEATFEPAKSGGVEIASAVQTGHVEIHDTPGKKGELPGEGEAEQASLDGASNVVTLTSPQGASSSGTPSGHPRLTRGDTSVSAETIRLMQTTGDVVAEGDVAATLVSADAKPGTPVTHVLAQQATMRRAAQTVEFTGTDSAPARMWQGASQVEAANLLLDRARNAMQAWPAKPQGVVRSVFASVSGQAGPGAQKKQRGAAGGTGNVVRVTSARLGYSDATHEAVFTGGVLAQAEDGTVRAQWGVAFLTPKAAGGAKATAAKGEPNPTAASVEKIVMSGGVRVQQPGRVGTGEQLLYTAATGEFVLTGMPGHPPHVADDKQGDVTGATLVFRSPDSTIVVAGEPASGRVHTETTIKK